MLAGLLLNSANQSRFGEIKTNLSNQFTLDNNAYLRTLKVCKCLLNNFLPMYRSDTNSKANNIDDVVFIENG